MRVIFVAALMSVFVGSPAGQEGSLPRELARHARQLGCGPIPEYYDRRGLVDPPYVYGVHSGPRVESALFWCAREGDGARLLVEVEGDSASVVMVWRYGAVGGLTIADTSRFELSEFRYADTPEESGPANVRSDRRVVMADNDGTYVVFFKHLGRWLFLMVD